MRTISLPDSLHATAEAAAAQAGFNNVREYLADLVRQDQERHQRDPDALLRKALADGGDPATVSNATVCRRKQEIETLLIQGLESGTATPTTSAEWINLRQRVRTRLGNKQ